MIEVLLSRAGTVVGLSIAEVFAPLLAKLRHYEPAPSGAQPAHRAAVHIGDRPEIRVEGEELVVRVPPDRLDRAGLQVVVDQAHAAALDRAGLAVLHASAVHLGDSVVAFWGASGAGKTTLAMELHHARGWDLVSNGSLVVGAGEDGPLVLGTAKTHVKLRESSLRGPGAPGAGGSATDGYEDKTELPIERLRPNSSPLPAPLRELVLLKITEALPAAAWAPADPVRTGVQLHEDVVRHLHGTEALLLAPDGTPLAPFPRLGTASSHRSRQRLIGALVARSRRLTGPLPDCAAAVRDAVAEPVPS